MDQFSLLLGDTFDEEEIVISEPSTVQSRPVEKSFSGTLSAIPKLNKSRSTSKFKLMKTKTFSELSSELSRGNSLTFERGLTEDLAHLLGKEPLNKRKKNAIIVDFDGTLIPFVRVMTAELGLPMDPMVNPIYCILLLLHLTKGAVVRDLRGIPVTRSQLIQHGCETNSVQYLIKQSLLVPSDKPGSQRLYVNIPLILDLKVALLKTVQIHCLDIFTVLLKCNQLGRLVIVSNAGSFWLDRVLNFILEALCSGMLAPPRWHVSHMNMTDDEMCDLYRSGALTFFHPETNRFQYPKMTSAVWRIPCICMKKKSTVFSEIVDHWHIRDLISIGDGRLEFNAAGTLEARNLHVRRVHFGYVNASRSPHMFSSHSTLIRELPTIVNTMEGTTKDVLITVPLLRTGLWHKIGAATTADGMPDAQLFDPLPSIPLFINRGASTLELICHDDTTHEQVDAIPTTSKRGIILRTHHNNAL